MHRLAGITRDRARLPFSAETSRGSCRKVRGAHSRLIRSIMIRSSSSCTLARQYDNATDPLRPFRRRHPASHVPARSAASRTGRAGGARGWGRAGTDLPLPFDLLLALICVHLPPVSARVTPTQTYALGAAARRRRKRLGTAVSPQCCRVPPVCLRTAAPPYLLREHMPQVLSLSQLPRLCANRCPCVSRPSRDAPM